MEVADSDPRQIMVRDSKNRDGEILAFPRESWMAFVEFSKDQSVQDEMARRTYLR